MMTKEMVTVILPVHNEEKMLERNVKGLTGILEKSLGDFEIIISEDGSTDRTPEIVKKLESSRVRVIQRKKRIGKGAAIRSAASYAKGNIIIFMDADLASNPEHVKDLVRLIDGGASIVIGSRYHRGSKTNRNLVRYFASRGFNLLVRVILGSRLKDHQCGFKAFRKDKVLPIVNKVENRSWFWDTEFLVRAQREGLRIHEIPIEWREVPGSKLNLVRDTYNMAHSLIEFRMKG